MIIESNELNLNNTDKELLAGVLGGIISKFYKNKDNMAAFEKEKESLKKEVKSLETKRTVASKKQKSETVG